MRNLIKVGTYIDVVGVPSPDESDEALHRDRFVRLGVPADTFGPLQRHNLLTAIAQYYGNVQEGLFFAAGAHLFRGLTRPLMHESNMRGDQDVLVYSWRPQWDYEWNWQKQWPDPRVPPSGRVFAIVARPLSQPIEEGIIGVLLHWTWIDEDERLKGAPVDYDKRFAEKVWSKRK